MKPLASAARDRREPIHVAAAVAAEDSQELSAPRASVALHRTGSVNGHQEAQKAQEMRANSGDGFSDQFAGGSAPSARLAALGSCRSILTLATTCSTRGANFRRRSVRKGLEVPEPIPMYRMKSGEISA